MRQSLLFSLLSLLTAAPAFAQRPAYPQGYFRNPLDIPISLAGNFGECRPGHFHSGLDIKTEGRENLVVRAAADGYVSRIKTEPGGFGHALYITHPNGYTTLYAHLNDFAPELQRFLRERQYTAESWTQDLALQPGQFPVKKGQQIAWSGNTGGSTAPHLHFEIRDTKTEHPLNGQLFGFAIKDTRPPVPGKIALYDADNFYSGEPEQVELKKRGDAYSPLRDTLSSTNATRIGIAIAANDYMDGSTNTLAFYTAELYLNEKLEQTIRLDNIGYDETRYVNAYADYRMKERGAPWYQCLFRLPGNALTSLYSNPAPKSGSVIPGKASVQVRIVLTDAAGNASTVRFVLSREAAYDYAGEGVTWPTEYSAPSIRYSIPQAALYAPVTYGPNVRLGHIARPDPAALSARHVVQDADIPVHSFYPLSIHPDKPVPFALRDKVVMICKDRDGENGRPATSETGGWYAAKVRSFGEFRLMIDSTAPVVKVAVPAAQWSKSKRITFTARDAMTSVKSFRGELDGKWILFEQRGSSWSYEFDDHCPPGKHTLIVTVKDESGNAAVQRHAFTR